MILPTTQERVSRQRGRSLKLFRNILPPEPLPDKYFELHQKQRQAQMKNFSTSLARYISEDGRVGMMVTLTFPSSHRYTLKNSDDLETVVKHLAPQYNGCLAFLYKMRKSKRIKHDIRYIATFELQSDGNIHLHIYLSVVNSDMIGVIEFFYDFKKRHTEPFIYNKKPAYPIGRMHIGISSKYAKRFQKHYTMTAHPAKSEPDRTEYFIHDLESREFREGDWTPVEFYDQKLLEELYGEFITKYLLKTADGKWKLDERSIKEGVAKNRIAHDTKTYFDDDELTRLQVKLIRLVGGKLYVHSRMPFPWKLYQQHRKTLIEHDENFKLFYTCIEKIQLGDIYVKNNIIYDKHGQRIAPKGEQS